MTTQRKPLVVGAGNRQAEIDSGDPLLVPGGVRTRTGNTGGDDVFCRSLELAPAGYVYCINPSGVREFYIGPDGSPATQWQLSPGTGPTAPDAGAINIRSDGSVLIPNLIDARLSKTLIVPMFSGIQSTKSGSTNKLALGGIYFDPTAAAHCLTATSTATFYMLLETTNGSIAASGELFQKSGTGAPAIIAATSTTTNTTATLCSAVVSTTFRASATAGVFIPRLWLATPNGTDQATCTAAWLEIKP